MAKTIEPMTSGSIGKRMIHFALPLLLGNLFQQLYNTVDSLIVGNYLGSSALAAVSSSGSLIFMLIGFLSGIGSGAGVVISQHFGAKDREHLHLAVHTAAAFGLVAGVLLTAAGIFLSPIILVWMDTPASVMAESVTYLQIYFAGSIGLIMYNISVGIMQAIGDSQHPLYYLVISSVINLILDIVFIGYLHTGVGGAALATVIAQFISAGLCIRRLMTTKEDYKLSLRDIHFHLPTLKKIVQIGLPTGIQNSIIAFSNVFIQADVNAFGEMAMAGYGAFGKVDGFVFLPIMSFNMAITTFIGQNLGAKQYTRTRQGAKFGILMSVVLSEIIGVVVFIFAPQIIAAFDSNPEVVRYGVETARASVLFYCFLAYSHAASSVLRGAGKTTVPMFIMMIFWCAVRVIFLGITIPLTHSIYMVYIVYPLTWILSSLAFFIYYHKANWLKAEP